MPSNIHILGLDLGSISAAGAVVDPAGRLVDWSYTFHHGDLAGAVRRLFGRLDLSRVRASAVTGAPPDHIRADGKINSQVALMTAAGRLHRPVGAILFVGAQHFGAIYFDGGGRYRGLKTNPACAAGTGGFLDQQARRLDLAGADRLGELAIRHEGPRPPIATRCAVFAKTDLVHAQSEGYGLAAICAGLCHGLAENIVELLFAGRQVSGPILFCGGVAQNPAVARALKELLPNDLIVEPRPVLGAAGAAWTWLDENGPLESTGRPWSADDVVGDPTTDRRYFYPPLDQNRIDFPDFAGHHTYRFAAEDGPDVEVDQYVDFASGAALACRLGVDVGSTSTKAVWLTDDGRVAAGFYTRTAGRPVAAVQRLLAAMRDLADRYRLELDVQGAAATGSGRKLVGRIIGADRMVDEITAHARAAVRLDPDVDTIIEIGGQDSKFTVVDRGRVVLAVMNHVCAAGTGSFVEELAESLSCRLDQIPDWTRNVGAPAASDRCTVFMERDVHHLLQDGFSAGEVMAAVLRSVVENYLTKVADQSRIGGRVVFQGATAKNRALAAVFQERLGAPVTVSRYCHLTGALGAALILAEEHRGQTSFNGLDLADANVPVRSEVCDLCPNYCKLTVAEVRGRIAAYGFLCGRDYHTRHKVKSGTDGYDLLAIRRKAAGKVESPPTGDGPVIGLPDVLYLKDQLPLWEHFFHRLGLATVRSEAEAEDVAVGRRLVGADFCAPMTVMAGRLQRLLDRADWVFWPVCLEEDASAKGVRRQYCYYSQFAPALAAAGLEPGQARRLLSPLVEGRYPDRRVKHELCEMVREIAPGRFSSGEVSQAYDQARGSLAEVQRRLKDVFREYFDPEAGPAVVLLGRPYTVLSKAMNKDIPGIFSRFGVKTFYQDMVDPPEPPTELDPLLEEIHWRFAAEIMGAAQTAARTRGLYPVLMTSFKCAPDAFVMDYFRKYMEASGKPYLILQIDEHGSSVGYETRIEAAIRSFENHYRAPDPPAVPSAAPEVLAPRYTDDLSNKTVFFPVWDPLTAPLITARLRRHGLDARMLEPTPDSLAKGLRHNTAQCMPLGVIAQEFMDTVEKQRLDPARTVLWMPKSQLSCNLGLFLQQIRFILHQHGLDGAGVYPADMSFRDLSLRLPLDIYLTHLCGGMIRKMACRVRPYEIETGQTDQAVDAALSDLVKAFENGGDVEQAAIEAAERFDRIEVRPGRRPQAAIFGDLYVRDNEVMNQGLIRHIEAAGGEVVTTPYSRFVQLIAPAYFKRWKGERRWRDLLVMRSYLALIQRLEKRYQRIFTKITGLDDGARPDHPEHVLAPYRVRIEQHGESVDNLIKIHHLKEHHPDLRLLIQTSPSFCCPSIVTEAMADLIERETGLSVVSITYDGAGGLKNEAVLPYLKSLT